MTAVAPTIGRSAADIIRAANRRIMVIGAPGTGKTTFSISASAYAGDTIPRSELAECKDVAVLQGDNEGIVGAYSAGFAPGIVYDLALITNWQEYLREVRKALTEIRGQSQIRFVVIDLSIVDQLVVSAISPSEPKAWAQVRDTAVQFFNLFHTLNGVTVVGNAHIKPAQSINENPLSSAAGDARAIGGERATYTTDLSSGVAKAWRNGASLQITRDTKRRKVGADWAVDYFSHTQSSHKYEAKSRFASKLKPVEPGERTLHALLKQALGALHT